MLSFADSPSITHSWKPKTRNSKIIQALWQGGIIVMAALALGVGGNSLRPDRIPLVSDWSMEAQLAAARPDDTMVISLEEAQAIFDSPGVVFVDARPEKFYRMGHIEGAIGLPWDDLDVRFEEAMGEVPRDTLVITYCDGEQCSLSKDLALALLGKGFANVRVLLNGWSVWNEAGLPTTESNEDGGGNG